MTITAPPDALSSAPARPAPPNPAHPRDIRWSGPLADRIQAAYKLELADRRVAALSLLHAMLVAGAPATIDAALSWRAIGCLLADCSIDLYPRPHLNPPVAGDLPRADYFWSLSATAHRISDAMHREMAVRAETAAIARGAVAS